MQVQGTGEARGCSHCRTQKARGWDPTPGTTHIISRRDSRGQRSSGWQIPTGSPSSCTGARGQVTVGMRPHTCLRAHISTHTGTSANISWSKQAPGRCFGPRQLHALHTQPHAGPLARPSHSQQHTHPAPLGANARTDPFSPPRTGRCGRTRSAHVPSDSLSQPPDGLPPPRPAQRSPRRTAPPVGPRPAAGRSRHPSPSFCQGLWPVVLPGCARTVKRGSPPIFLSYKGDVSSAPGEQYAYLSCKRGPVPFYLMGEIPSQRLYGTPHTL